MHQRLSPVARLLLPLTLAAFALTSTGCATNPATGKKQLSLYGEQQEIAMGRDADPQIVGQYGLVADEDLRSYVADVGARLAAESERPDLPWTFRVLDDPVVNAFALPGGYIYVTRGILAHMGSEAELAAVLGHEIGHVTARHGVNRLSKAQLAQLGLGIGMVAASPEMRGILGDLGSAGMQLLFLKYSRDDERQADELGFRYADREGYPPGGFVDVFRTLSATSSLSSGGERLPNYLATHPDPQERMETARQRAESMPAEALNRPWHRQEFTRFLDDMVYGYNPRQGYFRGREYVHPDLKFRLQLPSGWTGHNQTQALVVVSPDTDAIFQLTLAEGSSPDAAASKFFGQQGIEVGGSLDVRSGLRLQNGRYFRIDQGQGADALWGAAAFSSYDGRVYRLLTLSTQTAWKHRIDALQSIMESWSKLTDREALSVQPMRIDLVRIDRAMDIEEFQRRYPSSIEIERLAVLNQVTLGERMDAGRQVKRVRGFNPGPMMGVELR